MADEAKIKVTVDEGDAVNGMAAIGRAADAASQGVENAGKAAIKASGLYQDAEGRWRVASGRFASGAEKAAAGVEGVGKSSEGAKSKVHGFASALETVVTGALLKVGALAVEAGAALGKTLAGGVVKSIQAAADFEVGMNNFSAAAGKAMDEAGLKTQDFQKLFLDLGKKLPVSTMEVADAATALVKGGLDPAVIAAGGLESSLKFAAAAQMDLTAAAEVGIKQLAIFTDVTATTAEKTEFLAKAQDLLVKAAGASTTDVAQLSDAILMSAGQAKAAGLEYGDFITSITMVADKMPSAAEAGTSFKNMLMRLNPTTDKAKSAMSELGLVSFDTAKAINVLKTAGIDASGMSMTQMIDSMIKVGKATGMSKKEISEWVDQMNRSAFYDAQGNFVGMKKAAELLQGAFKGLTDEQKTQAMQTIFGNDGMAAANALVDAGTVGYDKYTKAIADANGVNSQSEATQKGLKFQLDQFNGSMEALAISIGTKFLPIATQFVEGFVMPAVNGLVDLAGQINFSTKDFEAFGKALQNNVLGIASGSNSFGEMFRDWFDAEGVGTAIDAAIGVMRNLATWVQANWPMIQATIKSVIDGVVSFINDPFTPVFNQVMTVIQGVVSWVQANWPAIATIIGDVSNVVKFVLVDLLLPIFSKILEAAASLVGWFVSHWPEISAIIKPIVDVVIANLLAIRDTILIAFDQAAAIGPMLGEIKTVVETKWAEVKAFVEGLPAAFVTAGQNIIQGLINGVVSKLKAFGDLWQRLSQDPIKTLGDVMNMHSPSQVMFDMGENIMKGLIYGIQSYRNKAVGVMESTAQAVQDAAAGVYQTPANISNVAAGEDAHDRRGGSLAPALAAAGNGLTGSLPQSFNASISINVMMDGAVLASTVVSIVQGMLQQEKARYGQP